MATSFRLSDSGLKLVDESRKKLNYTKYDEDWASQAGVSPSTLKRFWQQLPITLDSLKAICSAIDKNWEDVIEKVNENENEFVSWRYYAEKVLDAHKNLTTNIITSGSYKYDFEEVYIPVTLTQTIAERLQVEYQNDDFLEQFKKFWKSDQQNKKQRIAIIGKPGQGKTTLLQKIAFWILDNTDYLPIWVDIGDLQYQDLKGELLKNYLLDHWLLNTLKEFEVTSETKKDFTQQFLNHKVWLILDGVDEIINKDIEITQVLSIFKQELKGWIGEAAILLSCRSNIWHDNSGYLPEFEVYQLANFAPSQISNFISKWLKKKKHLELIELKEKLISKLHNSRYDSQLLNNIIRTPLFLAIWCHFCETKFQIQKSYDLNYTNFELYKFFVQKFYEWKKDKFPVTMQQRSELDKNLQKIAFMGINNQNKNEQTIFFPEQLEKEMSNSYMFWLGIEFGIFNQVIYQNEKKYQFVDLIFQYYYAVLEIGTKKYFVQDNNDYVNMLFNNNLLIKSWIIWAESGEEQTEQFMLIFYKMIKSIIKDQYKYSNTYLTQLKEIINQILESSEEKLCQNAARSIKEFTLRNLNNLPEYNNSYPVEILVNLIKISNDYRTMLEIIWSLRDVGINSEIAFNALDELWGKYILEKKNISKQEYNIIIKQLKDAMLILYLDCTDQELKNKIEPKLSSYQIL